MVLEELQYDNPDWLKLRERPHTLTTDFYKKSSAPYEAEAIDLGADFYDHIHDHRHDWSPGDKMPRERERSFLP